MHASFFTGKVARLECCISVSESFPLSLSHPHAQVEHSDDKTNLADAMEVEDMYESLEVN